MTHLTENMMFGELCAFVRMRGSQKSAANDLGISCQYLSDLLMHKRKLTRAIVTKLGYKPVVIYVPCDSEACK